MTKEHTGMKFSDYIRKQGDEFRKAGDGYDALSNTSKACIDYAVQRFVDEYAAKQQAIAFATYLMNDYKTSLHPESPILNDEQIYDQFIEQQNKDNG